MKRRTFLAAMAGIGAGCGSRPDTMLGRHDISWDPSQPLTSRGMTIREGVKLLESRKAGHIAPVLREEILENPGAVFIVKANVTNSRDESGTWKPCDDQMERFGRRVTELVFRKGTYPGTCTFIKPNMVGHFDPDNITYHNGWNVHPHFTGGMVDVLRDLGSTNCAIGVRGGLWHEDMIAWGMTDIFAAHDLPVIEAHVQYFEDYHTDEIQWHENDHGIVARRFPSYKPTFQPGTTFVNIAQAHTHQLGHTTLTIKNLQGIMPRGYGHVCDTWTALDLWRARFMDNFNPAYRKQVEECYFIHANAGFKYWDEGGYVKQYVANGGYDTFMRAYDRYQSSKGEDRRAALEEMTRIAPPKVFWAEQWCQRMTDMAECFPAPYVNMVEGVFGRGDDVGVVHTDFLTVGRSMTAVDSVTSWLMGHDPRQLPYLRIANERRQGNNNIETIPIFMLSERGVERVRDYRTLERTPLGVRQYGEKDAPFRFFT